MLRILHGTNYDFIKAWKWALGLTAAIILAGLLAFAVKPGINKSIEFTGGTLVQVHFSQTPDVSRIRSALDAGGLRGAEITQFGTAQDYTIRAQSAEQVAAQASGAEGVSRAVQQVLAQSLG